MSKSLKIFIGCMILFIAGGSCAYADIKIIPLTFSIPFHPAFAFGFISLTIATTVWVWLGIKILFGNMLGNNLNPTQIAQLKTQGLKIMTLFKAIDRLWNIKVNGQSPFMVFTQDDKGVNFQSEQLWFTGANPNDLNDARFMALQKLQNADPAKKYMIPVYVDIKNVRRQYMDLADMKIK